MGMLDGKVALITGGGKGQGRSHAQVLAREGADIIICDIDDQIKYVPYSLGTQADMDETARLVKEIGRQCLTVKADVRDFQQIQALVDRGISEFGKIDILCSNAGIVSYSTTAKMNVDMWQDMIDTNLTGQFNVIRAVLPHMIERNYGRIVATASTAARGGVPNASHYAAAKWGVIGLVKSVALEVAKNGITVNCVAPYNCNTDLCLNPQTYKLFCPEIENPTKEQALERYKANIPMGIPYLEPEDISGAVLYLVSPAARYITAETIHVAAGATGRNSC